MEKLKKMSAFELLRLNVSKIFNKPKTNEQTFLSKPIGVKKVVAFEGTPSFNEFSNYIHKQVR